MTEARRCPACGGPMVDADPPVFVAADGTTRFGAVRGGTCARCGLAANYIDEEYSRRAWRGGSSCRVDDGDDSIAAQTRTKMDQ